MLLSPCDSFESGMEEDMLREIEGNRPRSRTWPLPQPEDFEAQKSPEEKSTSKLEQSSKKGSRKNAWGNQSYADLITQAIQSTPEQRMTLSQIYAWMVENVVYFKDKGDNTSSAGWKNSIRHNLSLHNRFMRIQNEGNGKSSWWMVDADAKTEKTKRRSRSASLDSDNGPKATKTKRPGRKGKRSEHGLDDKPQSPNSKLRGTPKSPTEPSVILEDNPFPFPLADYRHRSSSNASNVSSISGRLSPIPSHDEELGDMDDMSLSPAQDRICEQTPVVVEELMDNMKENLNMTMNHSQPQPQADNAAFRARSDDSMNIDSPPAQFVDNRYPTTDFFSAPSLKQSPFAASKIPPQKSLYKEAAPNTLQQHLNGIYHRAGMNSPSNFSLPERNVAQGIRVHPVEARAPPPPYNAHSSRVQANQTRLSLQGNNYIPYYAQNDGVPMISVEMADSVALPGDFDIDFLERLDRDLTCDVETVLRTDSAFNDGHLDFNLDNYVSAIALPEISFPSPISGNMVH